MTRGADEQTSNWIFSRHPFCLQTEKCLCMVGKTSSGCEFWATCNLVPWTAPMGVFGLFGRRTAIPLPSSRKRRRVVSGAFPLPGVHRRNSATWPTRCGLELGRQTGQYFANFGAIPKSTACMWCVPGNSTPQRLPGFRHETQQKPILCSPSFLPDSRHFLFTSGVEGDVRIMVGSIDSQETKVLARGDSMAKYSAPDIYFSCETAGSWRRHLTPRPLSSVESPRWSWMASPILLPWDRRVSRFRKRARCCTSPFAPPAAWNGLTGRAERSRPPHPRIGTFHFDFRPRESDWHSLWRNRVPGPKICG